MKKKTKRLLVIISILLMGGLIYTLYTSVSYHSDSHNDHDHDHSKDECMCECDFDSNQNETSCKEHGGCEWINNQCVTEK